MFYGTVTSNISNIQNFLDLAGNPWSNVQTVQTLVPALIKLVLIAAVVVFFFLLLWGGIRWITAGGDKEKLAGAQKTLTAALIGIVILLSAWAIIALVQNFFGITLIGRGSFSPGSGPSGGTTCPGQNGLRCVVGTKSYLGSTCYRCQSNGLWAVSTGCPNLVPEALCF